ncbi:UDP:flavonoid glycosyltransferase YjiC (YdhE family) [Nocardioides luteus]|uniref:glycosyltransferase n=1 Tax=Nocardioides luteus TaxID=1844 RepID=UPI001664727B|nr:glycosyltransferase [Nocardioides luteus]MDR7310993.1 UDP:flavonoid glycosyltransferase YjiC (YdhE family) [Nocardioides luteus]
MRFVFGLMGSRGDVQPALAVALELRRRGHEVTVGVAPNLVGLAQRLGLDPHAVGPDSGALLASSLVREEMRSVNPRTRVRAVRKVSAHGWDDFRDDLVALAGARGSADVVVAGLLGQEVGSALAERIGAGFAALHYFPVRSNRSVKVLPGPGAVQERAWDVGMQMRWQLTRDAENAQRTALGLAPARTRLQTRLRDRGAVEVQAYDPLLVPGLPHEWGIQSPFAGFLALSGADRLRLGEASLGDDLGEWLDAGYPPVYVGFGSMPVADPARLVGDVAAATADLGLRALISSGWNSFEVEMPDHVRIEGPVDHATVLPRCVAAVHHGGAGTTAAVLRAGIPSVVGWYSADQPVWGRLLGDLGVGTSVKASRLDRERLREALATVLMPAVRDRAAQTAPLLIAPETAVGRAADALERAR